MSPRCSSLFQPGGGTGKLDLRQSLWFWLFISGLAAISYAGNYGNGLGLFPSGVDLLIVSAFSLAVFGVAIRDRLTDAEAAALLKTADASM